LLGFWLSDQSERVFIQKLSFLLKDGKLECGKFLLKLVHPCPTNDLIDLVIDLRQNFLEIGLNLNEGLTVSMRGTGLFDNFLKKHLVTSDPEGRLQELILSDFIRGLGIDTTEVADFLVAFYQFLQETLRRLRVENIIRIQLEKWDEFSENRRIELRIRVIIIFASEGGVHGLMEIFYLHDRGKKLAALSLA
jgi:hypothetical protein